MPTAEEAAVRLTNEAFQRGSNDNISCIVVVFKFGAEGCAAEGGNAPAAVSAATEREAAAAAPPPPGPAQPADMPVN